MKKLLDENQIAALTGVAIQDDETYKAEGGFVPERDQYYFQMKQGETVFLLGFKDILTCLRLLEKMGELPEIGEKWWQQVATLYGNDILMSDFNWKQKVGNIMEIKDYLPKSKLSTLASLVLNDQLSTKEAAAKASVSVSYFESYKQGFVEGALQKGIQVYHNIRKCGISKEEALAIADIPADAVKGEE